MPFVRCQSRTKNFCYTHFGSDALKEMSMQLLAPDPPGEEHVPGHDGDPPGVDGAQHCVLEEGRQVGLGGLLQRGQRRRLEAQARQVEPRAQGLGDLLDEPREGQPRDEELRALLVLPDLHQGLRPGPVPPARPLRPARRRSGGALGGRPRQGPREVGPGGRMQDVE